MPLLAKSVAGYFASRAHESGAALTHLKIQKLVYFAHAYHLVLSDGQPLISEQVQAWKFGPVVKSLYHDLHDYGADPIPHAHFPNSLPTSHPDLLPFLDKVWELFGGMSALSLSNLSHEPGGPWHVVATRAGNPMPKGLAIRDSDIRSFYQKKLDS